MKTIIILGGCLITALIILPCFFPAPRGVQRPACINNLRQIDGAKQLWAEEMHKTTNDTPTWDDLRDFFKTVPLKCPNGGTYTLGRIGELPSCSIPKDATNFVQHR